MAILSDAFIRGLLSTSLGKIIASNMLSGLRLGLYSKEILQSAMSWWQAIADFYGYTDEHLSDALRLLPRFARGAAPAGFLAPSQPPPMFPVVYRTPRVSRTADFVGSVRGAQTLITCGNPSDLASLLARGVDLLAKPGTVGYRRTIDNSSRFGPFSLKLSPGKSLTRADLGELALFWFTSASDLESRLEGADSMWRPDIVRDALGLVHYTIGDTLVFLKLSASYVEERPDRGRPTFLDAQDHTRFRCHHDGDSPGASDWGSTVDIGKLTDGHFCGCPERICGRMPADPSPHRDCLELSIDYIGSPTLSGKYTIDEDFAEMLERETVKHGSGLTLQGQLEALRVH
jgi:hypothetical protein